MTEGLSLCHIASHDKAAPRKSPAKSKLVGKNTSGKQPAAKPLGRVAAFTATGHLYTLDLRSHRMTEGLSLCHKLRNLPQNQRLSSCFLGLF